MEIQNPIKKYKTTNTVVYSCHYHIIFTPKYRRKVLVDGIDIRLHELILEKQTEWDYEVIEMEIMPDHVHLLLSINPLVGVNTVIGKIKGYSSRILRNEFPNLKTRLPCLWTRSKFISTVGAITLEVVKQYIDNQHGK